MILSLEKQLKGLVMTKILKQKWSHLLRFPSSPAAELHHILMGWLNEWRLSLQEIGHAQSSTFIGFLIFPRLCLPQKNRVGKIYSWVSGGS